MKKFLLAPVILLALFMGACTCSVEKQAIEEVERSHGLIATQLLKYVDKDPALKDKDKADWKGLVESDKRNIEKLKKAVE